MPRLNKTIYIYIYKINKIKTNALSSNTKWQMGAQSHFDSRGWGLTNLEKHPPIEMLRQKSPI